MPDKPISGLTAATTVTSDDLVPILDDPSGTPTTKKITFANFVASISLLGTLVLGIVTVTNLKIAGSLNGKVVFTSPDGYATTSAAFGYNSSTGQITAPQLQITNGTSTFFVVTQLCLTGDTCRTTWPTGGAGTLQDLASVTQLGGIATNTLQLFGGATIGGTLTSTGTAALNNFTFNSGTGTTVNLAKVSSTQGIFNDVIARTVSSTQTTSTVVFAGSQGALVNPVVTVQSTSPNADSIVLYNSGATAASIQGMTVKTGNTGITGTDGFYMYMGEGVTGKTLNFQIQNREAARLSFAAGGSDPQWYVSGGASGDIPLGSFGPLKTLAYDIGSPVSSTRNLFAFGGYFINTSSTQATTSIMTVTSTLYLPPAARIVTSGTQSWIAGATFDQTTSTNSTGTNIYVSNLATLPANTTIGTKLVCLADGTNCAASGGGGGGADDWQIVVNTLQPVTSTYGVKVFNPVTSTAFYATSTIEASSFNLIGMVNATATKLFATNAVVSSTLFVVDDQFDLDGNGPLGANFGNLKSVCNGCGSSSGNIFNIGTYGAGTPGINTFHANGSQRSPSSTNANQGIYFMGGRGRGATSWSNSSKAVIQFIAEENYTDSANGTFITLETTPIGSTARAERFRVSASGAVGIGTTSSTSGFLMDVNGAVSSTGIVATTGTIQNFSTLNSTSTNARINSLLGNSATFTNLSVFDTFNVSSSRAIPMVVYATSASADVFSVTNGSFSGYSDMFFNDYKGAFKMGIGFGNPGAAAAYASSTYIQSTGDAPFKMFGGSNGAGLKMITTATGTHFTVAVVTGGGVSSTVVTTTQLTVQQKIRVGLVNDLLADVGLTVVAPVTAPSQGDRMFVFTDNSKTFGLTGLMVTTSTNPTFRLYGDFFSGTVSANIVFATFPHSNKDRQLTISRNGNVGINLQTPSSTFDVAGQINTQGFLSSTSTVTYSTTTFLGVTGQLLVNGFTVCQANNIGCPTALSLSNILAGDGTVASTTVTLSGRSMEVLQTPTGPTSTQLAINGFYRSLYLMNASTTNCGTWGSEWIRDAWDTKLIKPTISWISTSGTGAVVWRMRAQSMVGGVDFGTWGPPSFTTSTAGTNFRETTSTLDLLTVGNAATNTTMAYELCRMGGQAGDTFGNDALANSIKLDLGLSSYSD